MTLEQKIYKTLTQHIDKCKVHKAFARALKPYILINPKIKSKELAEEIRKK